MKNKTSFVFTAMATLLILTSVVAAFGVSSPYWEGNPLKMAKGGETIVNLNLQNMVGEEDVTVEAELVEGSDITSLEENTFVVAAKTSDTKIPLKISLPKDIEAGESKTVKVEFRTVSEDTSGISMGTGMTILFNVIATEEAAEGNAGTIVTIIVVLLALAILFVILGKKKREQ